MGSKATNNLIYMYSLYLTIIMIIIKHCMYVCCWNKCGNVHYSLNFIFLIEFVKKQEITLS